VEETDRTVEGVMNATLEPCGPWVSKLMLEMLLAMNRLDKEASIVGLIVDNRSGWVGVELWIIRCVKLLSLDDKAEEARLKPELVVPVTDLITVIEFELKLIMPLRDPVLMILADCTSNPLELMRKEYIPPDAEKLLAPVEAIGLPITWTEGTSIVETPVVSVVDELVCASDSILPLDSADEVLTDEEVAPFCELFNCSEPDASIDGEELIDAADPSAVEATIDTEVDEVVLIPGLVTNTEEEAVPPPDNVKLVRSFGLVDRCSALPDGDLSEKTTLESNVDVSVLIFGDCVAETSLEDGFLESPLSWLELKSVELATTEPRDVTTEFAPGVWRELETDGDVLLGTVLVKLGVCNCVERTKESRMDDSKFLDSVDE
jgi:hypothetical protein